MSNFQKSEINNLIASEVSIVANKSKINVVIATDVVGTGTLEVFVRVAGSIWIDLVQPVDLSANTNTIIAFTGAPYNNIKFVPTPIAGKIETQTDFVFSVAKTIVTAAGTFIGFADGDVITVTGTTLNDGQYTITGAPTATTITVVEALVDETPAVSVSIKSFGATTTYDVFATLI